MTTSPITGDGQRSDDHRMRTAQAFEEHLTFLAAGGWATTTRDGARDLLFRADRQLPHGLCSATHEELATWLANPSWATRTRAVNRAHLVRFFRWAVGGPNPCLDFDPSAGLVRPRVLTGVPRPATDEQVQTACTKAGSPWRLICLLAAYAGLRCCEIARLDRSEITEAELLIHGKGGKDRVVPTDPYIWSAVHDLPPGLVARTPRGKDPTPQWVSAGTRSHLQTQLGLPTSLHRFRAWYATSALDACGDILVVKELLGHASVATTQIYTLVNQDRRRAAVAGLPRLAG